MNDDDDDDIEEQRERSSSTRPLSPYTRRSPSPLPPPRNSPVPPSSPTPYYFDDDGAGHHDEDDGNESDQSGCSNQEEEAVDENQWAMEAAAQELEARLANLRQYSNWRFNTRQYPSSPALESKHALWALRQTASGGLSLVLPATIEEAEGETGDFHFHRGKCLSTAIDEIQGLMSRRASRAWTRSATMAAGSGTEPSSSSSSSSFAGSLPGFARRQQQAQGEENGGGGAGRVSLGPGIGSSTGRGVSFHQDALGAGTAAGAEEGGEEEAAPMSDASKTAAATVAALLSPQQQQEQQLRDSQSSLRASLLSKPPPLWTAWERRAWTGGDYLMSLLVFVTLSITWWRGAWNLLNYYIYPNNRRLRVLTLVLTAIISNVLAFLSYPRLRQWSRLISSRKESYMYGGVKRLVLLVRMLASVMHWTGVWNGLDGIFCHSNNVNGACR